MSHPYEHPGYTVVPFEGEPEATIAGVVPTPEREGIATVTTPESSAGIDIVLSEENELDHGTQELRAIFKLGRTAAETPAGAVDEDLPEIDQATVSELGMWT